VRAELPATGPPGPAFDGRSGESVKQWRMVRVESLPRRIAELARSLQAEVGSGDTMGLAVTLAVEIIDGADVARQCLEAGRLDEVLVMVLPVLLGDGTRLFAAPGGRNVALEQISVTPLPTGFNAWMRVLRT
jgi:riboflavin biosynthesis pyrimidine reductase